MRRLMEQLFHTEECVAVLTRAEQLIRVLAGDQLPGGTFRWFWMP
jgi:hypothetical protein